MQGFLEEDPRYEKLKELASSFIEEANKLIPDARIFVAVEHPMIKHMVTSKDMPMHEMTGLLQVALNRLTMLDLDDIRFRIEATRLKQAQDHTLQEMTSDSQFKN